MKPFFLVLLSAALYTLAFPPFSLSALAFVALVPLLLAIRDLRPRRAALAGLLWGSAMIWGIGNWVPVSLSTYWGQSLWFGLGFAMAGSLIFVGSYGAGFAACASWLSPRCRGLRRITLLAALWVSWEVARGHLLTGDPWLLIGYAFSSHPTLIQIADVGGVYLVSFVAAFVNAALAEILAIYSQRPSTASGVAPSGRSQVREAALPMAAVLVMISAAYAYGLWRLSTPLPQEPVVPVTVIQGNNQDAAQWRPGAYGRGLDDYVRLSADAAARTHPRVIVWPEAAVTLFLAHEPRFQATIVPMLQAAGADLIVGAPHYQDDDPALPRFLNSAFYVTADGRMLGRYDKMHLLPFAEYFPLHTIAFLQRSFERVRTFASGSDAVLLDTRFGKTAVVICFEAMFPELVRERMARGAQVLVNLSNDVWLGLGGRAGPEQHAAMVPFRAVENHVWVIRATTTGVSAIIDPFGRVVTRSDQFVPAVLDAPIVPMQIDTLYKRYGDVFAYACIVASLASAVLLWRRRVG